MISLDTLNQSTQEAFAAALDGIFERAPWISAQTAPRRPFQTLAALHDALMATLHAAPDADILAFLDAHPDLSPDRLPATLTPASQSEQQNLAMRVAQGAAALPALNHDYRARFGHPFIICVARHTPENILRTLQSRLPHDPATERQLALAEIHHITLLRLLARIDGPGAPPTAGHLTTHVLDTQTGRPAANLQVTLLQESRPLASAQTNPDGRLATDLHPPGPLRQGHYELRFHVAPYFAARSQPTLYDTIPIRFLITHPEAPHHIPLLLAPFAYSTYRGS